MLGESSKTHARVLVIDDNPDTREYLEACLSPAYEVLHAATGEDGLAQAQRHNPDAVLLDLNLPGVDGLTVCESLKADPVTSHTAVLVMTVDPDPNKVREAFSAGADDFVAKPFDRTALKARLAARLRRVPMTGEPEEQVALLELTRLLASSLDLPELLHLVAVRTAEVLRVDRCAVVLFPVGDDQARVVAASEDSSIHDLRVPIENYPEFKEVMASRKPLVVSRVEEHASLQSILPTLVEKGIGSIALFPMMHNDKVDGLLFLRSDRFDRSLSRRDIFFANAVTAAVALALRNVRVANELRHTKQFMESVIDSSVDAIVAADRHGTIILFNKGAERIWGYDAEDVLGRMHVAKLYPDGVAREIRSMLLNEGSGGHGTLNTTRKEVVAANGEVIPIHLAAWIVYEDGREVATAGILTDLRERLQIEQKLSQAQEQLMVTEQQALIAELAGATAHELNQPLTSIMGYAEMARRKLGDAEATARIIDIVISETERMADIVRKIGRITRYETKSYVGGQRIVDLDRSSEPE